MTNDKNELLLEQLMKIVQKFRRQIAGGEDREMPPEGHGGRERRPFPPRDAEEFTKEQWEAANEGADFRRGRMGFTDPRFGFDGREARGPMGHMGHMGQRRHPMARERVLRLIGEDEGISQKKLAILLSIRPQSLSELLSKLEKDGFITRHSNDEDKRETLVYLTEQGKARAEEVSVSRAKQADTFFASLTEEEKVTLMELLDKLLDS